MSKKSTLKEFVSKSEDLHGKIYDYSLVNYINNKTKVIIICEMHGNFLQMPNKHLNGRGCPKCSKNHKIDTLEFIERSNKKHQNKYEYRETKYINAKTKVKIICTIHGEFEQTPSSHLSGCGCPECGKQSKNRSNSIEFIQKSNIIHQNKYTYKMVEYINSKNNVIITCNIHGNFKQIPNNHLSGIGCPICSKLNQTSSNITNYIRNKELGSKPGIFYKLKFKHKELGFEFLKIGITRTQIKTRYSGKRYQDYTYDILEEFHTTNLESALIESKFITNNKINHFIFPKDVKFNGYTECFILNLKET